MFSRWSFSLGLCAVCLAAASAQPANQHRAILPRNTDLPVNKLPDSIGVRGLSHNGPGAARNEMRTQERNLIMQSVGHNRAFINPLGGDRINKLSESNANRNLSHETGGRAILPPPVLLPERNLDEHK